MPAGAMHILAMQIPARAALTAPCYPRETCAPRGVTLTLAPSITVTAVRSVRTLMLVATVPHGATFGRVASTSVEDALLVLHSLPAHIAPRGVTPGLVASPLVLGVRSVKAALSWKDIYFCDLRQAPQTQHVTELFFANLVAKQLSLHSKKSTGFLNISSSRMSDAHLPLYCIALHSVLISSQCTKRCSKSET